MSRKILTGLLSFAMLLVISACSPGTSENPASPDETQPVNESSNGQDWADSFGDEYYDAMEDIMNAREEMLENFDGKWYNEAGMSEGRQDFRFSCLKEGVNLATIGSNGYRINAIYDDALRNAYDLTSYSIAMSGQVDYVERTGMETVMLIKRGDLVNPFIIVARAGDDTPPMKSLCLSICPRMPSISG